MSQLNDCRFKIVALLETAAKQSTAYEHARALHEQLTSGQDVDVSGIGFQMLFEDGTTIPVPMFEEAQLLERVSQGVNFLGQQIACTWHEIHATAGIAAEHCNQALAAVDGLPAVPPAAPQPPVSPPPSQPVTTTPIP